MLLLLFISLSLLLLVPLLFFFCFFLTADGDFTLMSKRHVKREEIEDKVVWITGASRGIGEVLAKQLASLGAKLILSARNEAELERVKKQLTGKHAPDEVKILPLDLASGEDSLREAVEKAESFFFGAGVDYMIHNAAYERPKTTALDVTEESLKVTFNINVLGTISLTRLLATLMLKRGRGHFVVMSSAAGKVPTPGQAVYSASKFALTNSIHQTRINSQDHPLATMKGKKEDPNAQPRRGSQPKAPTGLSDETAVETHDLIHRAEEEEQKMHGSHALTQPDSGPSEGKTAGQQHHSTMEKVKKALHMEK